MPPTTWRPAPSSIVRSRITRPPVAMPPRDPYRSTSIVRAPDRAAARAAAIPAAPPPATSTSTSSITGTSRAG